MRKTFAVAILLAVLIAPVVLVAQTEPQGDAERPWMTTTAIIIQSPTLSPEHPLDKPKTAYVNTHALNIRQCAGIDCLVLSAVIEGDLVEYLGAETTTPDGAHWLRVRSCSVTGWANSNYLEVSK